MFVAGRRESLPHRKNEQRFDFVYVDLVSFRGSVVRRDNRLGPGYEFPQGIASGRGGRTDRGLVDVCDAATLTLEAKPNG